MCHGRPLLTEECSFFDSVSRLKMGPSDKTLIFLKQSLMCSLFVRKSVYEADREKGGDAMEREEAERLVARYGPSVYRLAYARTGSKEDAEDVMQETFLRLVRAAPEFRDEEHGKAWLLRVATHCAADVFRMPWRKRDLPLEAARGVSSAPPKEPDSNVLAAVLSLPEKYRLPVHLFYYEGYSIAETAAVLGRRESTVRAQLTRARAMLREKLEVECI